MSGLDQRIQGDEEEGEAVPQVISDQRAAGPSPSTETKERSSLRYWISAWASVLPWMVILYAVIPVYMQLHGILLWKVSSSGLGFSFDPEGIKSFAEFNYVGYPFQTNEPTAASMWIEIIFWSYVGVVASQVYYITQLISQDKPKFEAGRYFMRAFGIITRATALGTAIIFLLRIVTLTIGPVTISLREADIQTIMAISFIVGFYNEDTERILKRLWKRAAQTLGASPDSDEEHSA